MYLETKIGDVTISAVAETEIADGVRFRAVELRDGDGQRIDPCSLPWWADEEIYKALETALERRLDWW